MTIYGAVNQISEYIEDNLEGSPDLQKMARLMGTDVQTMQRVFSLMMGVSLKEYIRGRRLSRAAEEVVQGDVKVVDLAVKYGYDSATAFARAFRKFHGVSPTEVRKLGNVRSLRNFPKLSLEVPDDLPGLINYELVDVPELKLVGVTVQTGNRSISKDAPRLFAQVIRETRGLQHPDYGMVVYNNVHHEECLEYRVLFDREAMGEREMEILREAAEKCGDFVEVRIPEFKAIKISVSSQVAVEIQKLSKRFYDHFLPGSKFETDLCFDLEHYHDNVTDQISPIYCN